MEKSSRQRPLTFHFLKRRLMDTDQLPLRIFTTRPNDILVKLICRKRSGMTGNYIYRPKEPDVFYKIVQLVQGGVIIQRIGEDATIRLERSVEGLRGYELAYLRTRAVGEFPSFSDVEEVGTYRESHGGGWYSDIPLYRFKGEYFADIECSQTMNARYTEQARLMDNDYCTDPRVNQLSSE